jgi:TPR repeat protein
MKRAAAAILTVACLTIPALASADWFLSAETKALMAKGELGDADAQFQVAGAYDTGRGAPHNRNDAVKWYLKAAEQGHAEAQNSLGSIFLENRDFKQAIYWYEKALDQGNAEAVNSLGFMYDLGLGVPQDRKKGFDLYTRAADLGWAEAMLNLAAMYWAGQLGEPDFLMTCIWGTRAERFARPRDRRLTARLNEMLPQVQNRLTISQLTSCMQEAGSWQPAAISEAKKD